MAKQYTASVSVNGGAATQHTVLIKDTETLFEAAFYFRVWKAFGMAEGDTFTITSLTGPTTVTDPMTWDPVPSGLIAIINVGRQISLAFIE
jgi:hypothetical protein